MATRSVKLVAVGDGLELFDLGPPSFAKMHIYVYIADLHGEVGQNILNGQKNMLKR